ncbi:hypothetical protein ACFCYB_27255 [Streptomyces sp. NPDC056309]|uniref:hypothetical protein n=1 Tax=unclassified Streptomyces TaxID=2593676 RepID=UPI0035D6D207
MLTAAASVGAHIIGWADDWEVLGATDPMTRPKLGPWLRDERGPYDGLVAAAVDRLGRNVVDGRMGGHRAGAADPCRPAARIFSGTGCTGLPAARHGHRPPTPRPALSNVLTQRPCPGRGLASEQATLRFKGRRSGPQMNKPPGVRARSIERYGP